MMAGRGLASFAWRYLPPIDTSDGHLDALLERIEAVRTQMSEAYEERQVRRRADVAAS